MRARNHQPGTREVDVEVERGTEVRTGGDVQAEMYTWGRGSTGLCTRWSMYSRAEREEWSKYAAGRAGQGIRQDGASAGDGQGMERSPARVGQIQILLAPS